MTLSQQDLDTTSQALAFARAFAAGDAEGAEAMVSTLAVEELPGFVSSLATFTRVALEVGNVPAGPFFDSMNAMIEGRRKST